MRGPRVALHAQTVIAIWAGAAQRGGHYGAAGDSVAAGAFNQFHGRGAGAALCHFPLTCLTIPAIAIPVGCVVSQFTSRREGCDNLISGQGTRCPKCRANFPICVNAIECLAHGQKFICPFIAINPRAIANLILDFHFISPFVFLVPVARATYIDAHSVPSAYS